MTTYSSIHSLKIKESAFLESTHNMSKLIGEQGRLDKENFGALWHACHSGCVSAKCSIQNKRRKYNKYLEKLWEVEGWQFTADAGEDDTTLLAYFDQSLFGRTSIHMIRLTVLIIRFLQKAILVKSWKTKFQERQCKFIKLGIFKDKNRISK